MNRPLEGKFAFVTGGSKGIGRAISIGLAEAGAAVAPIGTRPGTGPGTAHDTALQIEARGGRALPLVCDVRDPEMVKTAIEQAVAEFGRLDILINNAGVMEPGYDVAETDLVKWKATIESHINGMFLCAHFAIPHLIAAGGGSIVNMSSTAGDPTHDSTGNVAYAVAKAGVEQLTRGLARELARNDIAVNAIRPMSLLSEGSLQSSDWLTHYRERSGRPGGGRAGLTDEERMKLFSDPSAIVPAIVYLAQCRAEFSGNVVRRTDFENGRFRELVWQGVT